MLTSAVACTGDVTAVRLPPSPHLLLRSGAFFNAARLRFYASAFVPNADANLPVNTHFGMQHFATRRRSHPPLP